MAYGDFKTLSKRTAVDKGLRGRAKNPSYDGYKKVQKTVSGAFIAKLRIN